ncbi:MAG TPA: phospholipid carrier-dependent glycosyltransferase [Thermoanaerobaculia bacterium]|nr:phospholipid carrier-dependent glycosyltransferase [Thermoanaerobaculia bacterium]
MLGFLLPVLGLGLTAYVLGRTAMRWPFLAIETVGRLERWALSTALGLGLIAHLLLLLGLAHLLRPVPVLLLAAGIHALGIPVWRELVRDLRPGWRWEIALAATIGIAPLVLLALYPPTAFDATLYHLPFARAFVESGGVPYLLDRRVPVFPQVNEILFAAVMLFGPDVAAHGVQLLMTLVSAALAAEWGRRAFPGRPWVGWLAAALFLGNPIVVYLAGTGYIEAGLTLFVTAGLYCLDRWRSGGGRGWLILAAALTATACDVKYLGLFFLGVAGLGVLLAGRGRPLPARLRDGLLFGAVGLLFLAPWYLRILAFSGNPLFPFLPGIFGANPWTPTGVPEPQQPHGNHLAHWLRLPWDLVFRRDLYNQQPPFSPFYLPAVPLLLLGAVRHRWVREALALAALYALVFTFLPPDGRYLEPILPLASVAVAASLAIASDSRRIPRRAVAALCLLCFLPGWLYAGYRMRKQGPLPVTTAQRESYLLRSLPFYPAVSWLNRTYGSAYTVWGLHAESMAYLARGRFLGDWFGPAGFVRVLSGVQRPEDLHRKLRGLGAGYLLVTENGGLPFPEDGAFRRWFMPVYADAHARVYALRGRVSAVRSR